MFIQHCRNRVSEGAAMLMAGTAWTARPVLLTRPWCCPCGAHSPPQRWPATPRHRLAAAACPCCEGKAGKETWRHGSVHDWLMGSHPAHCRDISPRWSLYVCHQNWAKICPYASGTLTAGRISHSFYSGFRSQFRIFRPTLKHDSTLHSSIETMLISPY